MVAPAYAAARSDLAKNMGLGRRGTAAEIAVEAETPAPSAPKATKNSGKQSRKAGKASRN
jgi:hypothetical protein